MKREANFQTTFNHWLKECYKMSGCFELKQVRGTSLPFDALAPHQKDALFHAKHGTFVFKIPDAGYQNPFDCFSFTKTLAFVVVKYTRFFCLIDIDAWIEEEKTSERRSLTQERARAIASMIVEG